MWVFTDSGFFSLVEVNGDHTRVVMLTRVKDHLKKLQKLASHMFIPIREDEGTDYAYQVYTTKEQWKEAMGEMVDGIDYTKGV